MKTTKIDYSIVIPHHNIPVLLQRCLDSIPDIDTIEVIIVDDNSDRSIVDFNNFPGINRNNTKVVFSKEGKGGGHARNVGLNIASGKWVLFADADDFFTEDFEEILGKHVDDDNDILYFNIVSVYSDDISKLGARHLGISKLFDNYRRHESFLDTFRVRYPEPWGKIIKRRLIVDHKVEFDETKVSNDYFFSVQVGCLSKKIKIVDRILYIVTVRPGSVSYNFAENIDVLTTRLDVAIKVQSYIQKFGYSLSPMPVRGLLVLLLKTNRKLFLKYLYKIYMSEIPLSKVLVELFSPRYFNKGIRSKI
ncbi:glycosyltransferase family 2 protein [Sphingobacterium haloxyli]|uniref:Glycosyl transferase family 2 n=1 Tax=Sphingobacterium haloxyli TaxID=2100533 RepID=A0A2S9J256_9SPHI|nr:glycosyltransferase family A protein [Sphingobacterium haloxyli]PRD46852.1 glycosyl transferase family 2 [Sphingobacterium haloxyli]